MVPVERGGRCDEFVLVRNTAASCTAAFSKGFMFKRTYRESSCLWDSTSEESRGGDAFCHHVSLGSLRDEFSRSGVLPYTSATPLGWDNSISGLNVVKKSRGMRMDACSLSAVSRSSMNVMKAASG